MTLNLTLNLTWTALSFCSLCSGQESFRVAIDMHYDFLEEKRGPGSPPVAEVVDTGVPDVDTNVSSKGSSNVSANVASGKVYRKVSAEVSAEVISPSDFTTLHSRNGGLSKTGIFTMSYWATRKEWVPPRDAFAGNFPVVKFRSIMNTEDFSACKRLSYPDHILVTGHANDYDRVKIAYNALKMVGVGPTGQVYRVPDEDIVTTSSLPPGFSNAMYVKSVQVFLERRAALETSSAKASATSSATASASSAKTSATQSSAKTSEKPLATSTVKKPSASTEKSPAKTAEQPSADEKTDQDKRKRQGEETGKNTKQRFTHNLYHAGTFNSAESKATTTATAAAVAAVAALTARDDAEEDTEEEFQGVVDQLLQYKGKGKAKEGAC